MLCRHFGIFQKMQHHQLLRTSGAFTFEASSYSLSKDMCKLKYVLAAACAKWIRVWDCTHFFFFFFVAARRSCSSVAKQQVGLRELQLG